MRAGDLTARGADRALRVAWTLSDLAGAARPDPRALVDAALYFRDRRRRVSAPSPGRPPGYLTPARSPEEVLRPRAYLLRCVEPPRWALVAPGRPRAAPVEAADRLRRGAGRAAARRGGPTGYRPLRGRPRRGRRPPGPGCIVPEHRGWPHVAVRRRSRRAPRADLAPPIALWARGPGRISPTLVRPVGHRRRVACRDPVRAARGRGLLRDASPGAAHAVLSGAAFGIDAAAHRGALAVDGADGRGAGLRRRTAPTRPRTPALLERIAATGLVLTEYPPGSDPRAAALPRPQPPARRTRRSGPWSSWRPGHAAGRSAPRADAAALGRPTDGGARAR
jgi:DNA processing protein